VKLPVYPPGRELIWASRRLCHGDNDAHDEMKNKSRLCVVLAKNLRLEVERGCEGTRALILDPANPRCASRMQTGQTYYASPD
jgi:hypothetical protein